MVNAMKGAMGSFGQRSRGAEEVEVESQNFLPVSYQAYQPSMPMQNGAAVGMSVEAPRENESMAMVESV